MHRGFLFGLILFLTIITEKVCLSQSKYRFESPLYAIDGDLWMGSGGVAGHGGMIWLGSKNRIVRYNPRTCCFSPAGELFMGGDSGVTTFNPDSVGLLTSFPQVVVESVEYFTGEGWEKMPFSKKKEIRVGEPIFLKIKVKAIACNQRIKTQLMYRIEGYDEQWRRVPDDYQIFLPDMKNKIYRLYVRSSNDDRVLSKQKLLLNLHSETLFRTKTLIMIIILIMIVVVFAYIDYRIRSLRKTNQILKEKEKITTKVIKQRDQLSVMHKDLTDSIRYARKIQQALLPSDYYFHRLLYESFILYLPKDIVSGDFYWINEKDGKVFFSVADCTGHGVPGAFMSMIGFEILDKIINDQGIVHPDEILSILNHGIMNTFSRGEDDLLLRDGMDISFCTLDKKSKVLEFAGAFHTLYLVRENTLLEYKGDHVSVGLGEEEKTEQFTKYLIELQEEDCIYLFSDGYPDQFGGLNGKKFMYRRFRHLLLSIHNLPMKQQRQILYDTLLSWRGDREQVDDILIIGVNPLGKSK